MNILDLCDPSDPWDRRTLALWHEAQERHDGKIELKAKDTRPSLWSKLTWLGSILAAFFGAISAFFSREKKVIEGWRDGWTSAPNLLSGEFTAFSYTIFVPGSGRLLKVLPAAHRFEILWHQITHIDHVYLGWPLAAYEMEHVPKRSKIMRLYDRWIGANIIRVMWVLWRWPFGHATFRQSFEAAGCLCEVRVELVRMKGSPSDIRRQLLAQMFSGPEYGHMATKKLAAKIANDIMDQAVREYKEGWIQARMDRLENQFYKYYPEFPRPLPPLSISSN